MLGYGLGMMNKSLEAQAANMPNKPPTMAQGSFSGPPRVLALNLAVFSAVQGGLTLAIKKARGGVEDIQGSMMAMFGAGSALSLVGAATGSPTGAMGGEAPRLLGIDATRWPLSPNRSWGNTPWRRQSPASWA